MDAEVLYKLTNQINAVLPDEEHLPPSTVEKILRAIGGAAPHPVNRTFREHTMRKATREYAGVLTKCGCPPTTEKHAAMMAGFEDGFRTVVRFLQDIGAIDLVPLSDKPIERPLAESLTTDPAEVRIRG
jgi:hypothetical protein